MSVWQLPRESATLFAPSCALDRRQHRRFARLVAGLLFAHGRRTVTAWFRAGGLSHQFRAATTWSIASDNARPAGHRIVGACAAAATGGRSGPPAVWPG